MLNTIYIDVLIFLNFVIDYLILSVIKKVLNINVKLKRIIIGSIFASLFSLTALLPSFSFIMNLLTNILIACIITFITFGKCRINVYVKRVFLFFVVNFIFAGIMIAVYLLFKPSGMVIINNVVYFNISPILLIILTIVCYFILLVLKRLFGKQFIAERICNITVYINNNSYRFKAKVDTGCDLKEPFSNKPVIVAEKVLFNNLIINKTKVRLVPFSSLGGEGVIEAVPCGKIYIDNMVINREVYIGFCENVLNNEIKALISNDILGDEFI